MNREWPTNEECYAAMAALAQDYFTGAQLAKWQQHIDDGLVRGQMPAGKGFLHELDGAVKVGSPMTPQQKQWFDTICAVCI
ncbi:hypothetical protein [Shewanella sp.]|uniref:hypothetical protein n=1 Tax=Shewanella sp. TaxID=50422 RepID=UPI003A96E672